MLPRRTTTWRSLSLLQTVRGTSLYGLAAAGAMGNIFTTSESLVFSSLISSVDPVAVLGIFQDLGINKDLYFFVFGESLLNVVEPLSLLGLSYLCYLTAELFHFPGIMREHCAHMCGPVAMTKDKVKLLDTSTSSENKTDTSFDAAELKEEIPLQPRSVEPQKHSSLLPLWQRRAASKSSEESPTQMSQDTQALQKALRSHPYNKFHFKHNPSLVREEDQELNEYLYLRYRRVTRLASSTHLPSSNNHSNQPESHPNTGEW